MITRRGNANICEASVNDVVKRILRKVRHPEIAKRLIDKVKEYTKNKGDDLTQQEQRLLYNNVDFGETLPLSKKRKVDIGWTDHAEYRSELRDVDHGRVNDKIKDRLRNKLQKPDKKDVRFKEPGLGTFVVDYDMTKKPADAAVITVWASEELKKVANVLRSV